MPEYLAHILAAAVVIGLAYSIATKNWWVVLTAFNIDMISRGLSFYICVALSGIITLIGYIIIRRRKKKA